VLPPSAFGGFVSQLVGGGYYYVGRLQMALSLVVICALGVVMSYSELSPQQKQGTAQRVRYGQPLE
jgi:hypothetical protein